MTADALATVAASGVVGVVASVAARALRIPAILPLLVAGAALGDGGAGWVRAGALGAGLPVLVEVVVGVILFEGAATLSPSTLRGHGRTVRNLVTVGAFVTGVGATLAARFVLDLPWDLAAVVGSILVVTGPTVVAPILSHVRPRRDLAEVLRWEGIVIDPIGALGAVAVLEFVLARGEGSLAAAATRYASTLAVGVGVGVVVGAALDVALRRVLARRDAGPAALAACLAALAAAEAIRPDAGLFAVTTGGLVLGLRRPPGLDRLEGFLSDVVAFALPWVFVLLASRIVPSSVLALGGEGAAFLGGLVLVRWLGVRISSAGSSFSARDRLFLAWVAPRGVVAVTVASLFSSALVARGIEGGDRVFAVVVLVVLGTVVVFGSTARPLARALGVLAPPARTTLVVGAGPFGHALVRALAGEGVPCVLVDKNPARLPRDPVPGVEAVLADAIDDEETAAVDVLSLGLVVAATPNDEANALVCAAFARRAPAAAVVQLPTRAWAVRREGRHEATRWPFAFGDRLTLEELDRAVERGAVLRVVEVAKAEDATSLRGRLGTPFRPLLVLRRDGAPVPVALRNAVLPGGVRVVGVEDDPEAA